MKITYLFGAGASFNALPIVNKMPERLQNFYDYLARYMGETAETRDACARLVIEVKDLIDVLVQKVGDKWEPKISSIDTYAKQLLITRQYKKLDSLKAVITLFFAFEQKVRGVDLRYDSFFASIIKDESLTLPPSITILSWNYDMQFELAFRRYTDNEPLHNIRTRLGVVTKGYSYSHMDVNSNDRFRIFKLNGTATLLSQKGHEQMLITNENGTDIQVELLLLNYSEIGKSLRTNLSYSWEGDAHQIPIHSAATKVIEDTECLVIVGYSFPFFNRAIDQSLIKGLPRLRKVYFQDTKPEDIVTRFKAVRGDMVNKFDEDIETVVWPDINQFALPDELTI